MTRRRALDYAGRARMTLSATPISPPTFRWPALIRAARCRQRAVRPGGYFREFRGGAPAQATNVRSLCLLQSAVTRRAVREQCEGALAAIDAYFRDKGKKPAGAAGDGELRRDLAVVEIRARRRY